MWLQILLEFYSTYPAAMQLELASTTTEQVRYRNQALLTLVPALLICPVFPLMVIALWNIFKPRRARRDLPHDELDKHKRTSSGGVSKGKGEGEHSDMTCSPQLMITVHDGVASVRCGFGLRDSHSDG
jgi:hypothetical protein